MEDSCDNCGNKFTRSFDDPDASCCSLDCKYELSRDREFLNCDNCDNELELRPSEITDNNFCDRDCYHSFRSKNKVTLNCEFCGNEFKCLESKESVRRTCSNECKYKLREKESTVIVNCDYCDNEISRKKFRADGNNYCDHKCYGLSKQSNEGNWHSKSAHRKWSNKVKEKHDGCVECTEKTNIQAHHIIPVDVNREKADNVNNGVALCPECHSNKHPDVPDNLFKNVHTKN